MTGRAGLVLLGTVAVEPNRWATRDPSGAAQATLDRWADRIDAAGFDGLELWDRHLPSWSGAAPVVVYNSYVDFDAADDDARLADARRVADAGASAVKFNVGGDPTALEAYAARLSRWVAALPPGVDALCECHRGTSIAEDPDVAARLFDAADQQGRVGAIVHTHDSADLLRRRFAAYGPRISHVHVNYLDADAFTVPPLAERRDDLAATAALLVELGFAGSWTLEFVAGVLTDRDEPGPLLDQAEADLAVLRDVLREVGA